MSILRTHHSLLTVLCLFWHTLGSSAIGCTIPVFRFALDRWEPDKFHLVLSGSTSQNAALQELLRPLRANGKANLEITTARNSPAQVATLSHSRESDKPLWSGTLDESALNALLDSPGRRQLMERILAGDSAVWVIVDGGSPVETPEVDRIEKRLKFLEQVAALPIQDPNDPDSQLGPGPPLRLKFSTLRIRRGDPEERIFIPMLAGPRAEFDPATTAFAAVVFGKGRVLGAWPLAILDDLSLEETSLFLVGRCSCRLKNENPGWDLLLNTDWEKRLESAAAESSKVSVEGRSADVELAAIAKNSVALAPQGVSPAKAPEQVVIQPAVSPTSLASKTPTLTWSLAALAMVAGVGWVLIRLLR